jgi:hypothetical protein
MLQRETDDRPPCAASRTRRPALPSSRVRCEPRSSRASFSVPVESGPSRTSVAPASRAILQHGAFLGQRVHDQGVDVAVAGMQAGALEQPRADAASAQARHHRDAELGTVGRPAVAQVGQVSHRDQVEAAVEDAEDLVAIEVEHVDVAAIWRIIGRVAEAQVAVRRVQADAGVPRCDRGVAGPGSEWAPRSTWTMSRLPARRWLGALVKRWAASLAADRLESPSETSGD